MRHGRALDGGGRGEARGEARGGRGEARGEARGIPRVSNSHPQPPPRGSRTRGAPRARARAGYAARIVPPHSLERYYQTKGSRRFRAAAMNILKHGFFFWVVVGAVGVWVGVGGGGDGAVTSDSFAHSGAWAVTFVGTRQLLSRELAPRHQFWWLCEILVFHPKRETAPGWLVTHPRFQKKKKIFLKKKEPRPGRLKRGPAPTQIVVDRRFAA